MFNIINIFKQKIRRSISYFSIVLILVFLNSLITTDLLPDSLVSSKEVGLYLVACLGLIFSICYYIRHPAFLVFNAVDLLVVLFLIILPLIQAFFCERYSCSILIQYLSFLSIYFSLRILTSFLSIKKIIYQFFIIVFTALFLNIFIAMLQQIYSGNDIKGFFSNSGPFSIYLSIMMTVPISYILNMKSSTVNIFLIYFLLIASLFILVLTQSRSAFIGLFSATIFLLSTKFSFRNYFFDKSCIIIFSCIMLLLIPLFYWGYSIKQNSAEGRMLIWHSTLSLISDNFWTGVGFGRFASVYMEYQELVLSESHMYNRYGILAGDVRFAFNDYLQIFAERGIVSLLCFISIPMIIFKSHMNMEKGTKEDKRFLTHTIGAMLICLLCASFTSYPLQILPIQLMFWSCVAIKATIISRKLLKYKVLSRKKAMTTILIMQLTIIGFYGFAKTKNYILWHKLISNNTKSIESLQSLKLVLNENPLFLFDLANAYESNNRLEEAIFTMNDILLLNSYPGYYYKLANLYEKQGRYELAKEQYNLITKRIPNLIRPHYLVTLQYYKTGDLYNFQKYGRIFLKLKPKINNFETNEMKFDIYTKIMESEIKKE